MLSRVKEESKSKCLTINVQEMKWLVMSKNAQIPRMEVQHKG